MSFLEDMGTRLWESVDTSDPNSAQAIIKTLYENRTALPELASSMRELEASGRLPDVAIDSYNRIVQAVNAQNASLARSFRENTQARVAAMVMLGPIGWSAPILVDALTHEVPYYRRVTEGPLEEPGNSPVTKLAHVVPLLLVFAILATVAAIVHWWTEPERTLARAEADRVKRLLDAEERLFDRAIAEGLSAAQIAEVINPIVDQLAPVQAPSSGIPWWIWAGGLTAIGVWLAYGKSSIPKTVRSRFTAGQRVIFDRPQETEEDEDAIEADFVEVTA